LEEVIAGGPSSGARSRSDRGLDRFAVESMTMLLRRFVLISSIVLVVSVAFALLAAAGRSRSRWVTTRAA